MTEGRQKYAEDLTRIARQVLGVVFLSWRRILRMGLITAALAMVTTEAVSCLLSGSFPPAPATHLVAVAMALALGYGAAVTMLMGMLLTGGVKFIRHLEGDMTVGARATSVFARRAIESHRVTNKTTASRNSAGKSRKTGKLEAASAKGRAAGSATESVGLLVGVTQLDVRRDPDDAIIQAPAPEYQSLPVPAARMPRIGWTYDEKRPEQRTQPLAQVSVPAPAPSHHLAKQPAALSTEPAIPPAMRPLTSTETPEAAEIPAAPDTTETAETTATPSVPADQEASETPGGTPDVPGLIPRGWRANGSVTRPLPAITSPLNTTDEGRLGGLWKRVSQALVGEQEASEPPGDERGEKPASSGE